VHGIRSIKEGNHAPIADQGKGTLKVPSGIRRQKRFRNGGEGSGNKQRQSRPKNLGLFHERRGQRRDPFAEKEKRRTTVLLGISQARGRRERGGTMEKKDLQDNNTCGLKGDLLSGIILAPCSEEKGRRGNQIEGSTRKKRRVKLDLRMKQRRHTVRKIGL